MRRESKTLDLDAKTMDFDAKTTNVDAAFIYMIYLMYWIWLMNFTPCHPPDVLELLGRPDRTAETEAGPVLAMAMDMIMTTFRLSSGCTASRLVFNLRRHPPTSSSSLVGPDPQKNLKRSKTLDLDAKTTMSTQIRPVSSQPSSIWCIWWTGSSWWTSPYVIHLMCCNYLIKLITQHRQKQDQLGLLQPCGWSFDAHEFSLNWNFESRTLTDHCEAAKVSDCFRRFGMWSYAPPPPTYPPGALRKNQPPTEDP